MTAPRTLVSFVDANHWPTMVRGDLYARYQRLTGGSARHWIVIAGGADLLGLPAHLDIACEGIFAEAEFVDSAQVMVDRLLSRSLAYSAGRRIFLPWEGAPGYSPVQQLRGRRGPFDVQLWGPHWDGGPEGPSATLLRWAAIHEVAGGPVDQVFGFTAPEVRRASALAQALGAADVARAFQPGLRVRYDMRDPALWDGPRVRWTAMQVTHELRPAQADAALEHTEILRRIPLSIAERQMYAPQRAQVVQVHADLKALRWRQAVSTLMVMVRTARRMWLGHWTSRDFLRETRALVDGLGL